jgi:hypothetical protein
MVKAKDLIKVQKEKEKIKYKSFSKIYSFVEKKINLASSCGYYYTWYHIPEFIIGYPLYNLDECKNYIIDKLKKDGFDTNIDESQPTLIIIKWFEN